MTQIELTGLSSRQLQVVQQEYHAWIQGPGECRMADIQCHAGRLPKALDSRPEDYVEGGLYTTRSHWSGNCLRVKGMEFEATYQPGDAHSSIATFLEMEFPESVVLGNLLRTIAAYESLRLGGLLLHSAGIVVDGQAWLFFGRSNAGKTTLTRKAHSAGFSVLSDDINLLLPCEDGYRAFPVPFTGEFSDSSNHPDPYTGYPLAGIVMLEQASVLGVLTLPASLAVAGMFSCSPFVNSDSRMCSAVLDTVTSLCEAIPPQKLKSRRADAIDSILAVLGARTTRGAA